MGIDVYIERKDEQIRVRIEDQVLFEGETANAEQIEEIVDGIWWEGALRMPWYEEEEDDHP